MPRTSWLISVIVVISFLSQDGNAQLTENITSEDKFGPHYYVNVKDWPGEKCNRVCKSGDRRFCYFEFHLEHYQAMGAACGNCSRGVVEDCFKTQCLPADGIERGVMSINRGIPGPQIHVCHNDMIIADVKNMMGGTAASIHWHGIHQRKTPHMDGVPFITQCPIEYSTTFRYGFKATEPGTHWYHGHSGHQKTNGIYGALVVRAPKELDPNNGCYDFDLPEHNILVSDWMHETAEMFTAGLPTRPVGILPNSLLINGHGSYFDRTTGIRTRTPHQYYYVRPNTKYRMRLINAVGHVCPIQVQVEKHRMTILSSDSFNVHPREVDTFYSGAGERYDFVVHTNQIPGDYFIRARAIGPCSSLQIEQFAVMRYIAFVEPPERPIPPFNQPFPTGLTLNFPNTTCFDSNPNDICITELLASEPDVYLRNAKPDVKFYIGFDTPVRALNEIFAEGQYPEFANVGGTITIQSVINGIQFQNPSISLLTQRKEIKESMFCDTEASKKCSKTNVCTCLHRLKIKLGAIVELLLVDESARVRTLNHVFHLHGYKFMVKNMGQHPQGIPMTRELVQEMEKSNTLPICENQTPPFKDTLSIPSKGFAAIRFVATNPGFWFLHCHFEWHMNTGMALVLQVGEHDEMVKPPKKFPTCGDFKGPVYSHDIYDNNYKDE